MTDSRKRIPIKNSFEITWAVMEARKVALDMGFPSAIQQMISTAVSELANNIIKYASKGEILIMELREKNRHGIEIMARDRGPGIADLDKAMADNFSTGGTLGLGLPGIKRMMDYIDIQSSSEKGTTVVIRKWL